jgi:hypothetical protein
MREWFHFGEQVNRLVYTLAGAKFMGDIETANRFVAERIHYSEVSVRMMRQGRFRPQDDKALELMVQVGKQEAELGYWWARRLLKSGRHPTPEPVLKATYDGVLERFVVTVTEAVTSPILFFTSRAVSAFIGSIVLLGIWTYFISPGYPPPHELETFLELIWGVFTGIGLAVGLGIIDFYQAAAGKLKVSRNWWRYLVLPAGGLPGALLWHFGGNWLFHPNPTAATQSSAIEAFTFGVSYTLGFVILIVWLLGSWARKSLKYSQMAAVVLMVVLGGTAALMGFLLAYYHPAFSNQKDIDLFVGITLRAGLAIAVGICFPPLLFPEFQNPKELTWIPWHGLYPSEKKDD